MYMTGCAVVNGAAYVHTQHTQHLIRRLNINVYPQTMPLYKLVDTTITPAHSLPVLTQHLIFTLLINKEHLFCGCGCVH